MDTSRLMLKDLQELARLPAILCALSEEFAPLAPLVRNRRSVAGFEILELEVEGRPVLGGICGVGKVWAARAATILAAEDPSCLLIAGVCGGLAAELTPGVLVHGTGAAQWDAWNRRGRESEADDRLLETWQQVAPGPEALFLTGDRAVFHPLRARGLRRVFPGSTACDMETAAAAAIAGEAKIPWAVLRAVTDRPRWFGRGRDFRGHFPVQAGRAAKSIPALLEALRRPSE